MCEILAMATTTIGKNIREFRQTLETKEGSESDTSSEDKVDCNICCEEVWPRNMVACPFCDHTACQECTSRFLLETQVTMPMCMSPGCKKNWSLEYISNKFPPAFHNSKYRDHRTQILFEQEMSMLPGTQMLVKQEKKKRKNKKKITDLQDENAMLGELIMANKRKIRQYSMENSNRHADEKEEKKERKEFTRACPVDDCRGFLSARGKCGTCSGWACMDCRLSKNGKDDEEHECNPDTVATYEMLAKDTKSCPSCATMIYKIHGCDQMYCTQCNTAFSWIKGTIETGVIHNPHYYEIQRKLNGGVAPRVRGDVRCGGMPFLWMITERTNVGIMFPNAYVIYQLWAHIIDVELPRFPNVLGNQDNSDLRVKYLMNDIDQSKWKTELKRRAKAQERNMAFNQVLTMFTTMLAALMSNIVDSDLETMPIHVAAFITLREYTNKELAKVGWTFGNVYPYIGKEWTYHRNANRVKSRLVEDESNDEEYDN